MGVKTIGANPLWLNVKGGFRRVDIYASEIMASQQEQEDELQDDSPVEYEVASVKCGNADVGVGKQRWGWMLLLLRLVFALIWIVSI